MLEVTTIEGVQIFAEWENGKEIFILLNQGPKIELIDILQVESDDTKSKSWKELKLPPYEKVKVELTTDFLKCEQFGFNIKNKPLLAPINELTKLLNDNRPQPETQECISTPKPVSNISESTEQSSKSIDPGQQFEHLQEQTTQLEQRIAERDNEITHFNEQLTKLSQENSELKMQLEMQNDVVSSDPEHVFREAAHHVLQTLLVQHENTVGGTSQDPKQICKGIEAEIKRFEELHNVQMNYTLSIVKEDLTKVKDLIKFELSELSTSENKSEHLAKLALSDEPPIDVQFPYLGELGKSHWNDLKTFRRKLPQVLKETQAILYRIVFQLLDGFSPYHSKETKEEQMISNFYEEILPNILKMLDLELVPIEIGQTEADFRIHDIQGSQRGAFKRGVVAYIVQHGIYRISDKQIIRKPVVIRGEPD